MISVEPVLSSCILAFFFGLQVELVLNYDIPKDHKDYIHRFQSFPNNPRDVIFFIPSSFNTPLTPLLPSIVARPTQCMYPQVPIICVCTLSTSVSLALKQPPIPPPPPPPPPPSPRSLFTCFSLLRHSERRSLLKERVTWQNFRLTLAMSLSLFRVALILPYFPFRVSSRITCDVYIRVTRDDTRK